MSSAGSPPRRNLLRWLGLSAAAGAAMPLAAKESPQRLSFDMAILGHTDAPNSAGRIGDPRTQDYFGIDVRGDSFYVEGLLYPAGTIPRPTRPTALSVFKGAPEKLNNEIVWDFTAAQPIGHWFSRGWVLINGRKEPYRDSRGTEIERARTQPHLLSEHTFVIGLLGPENLSPPMLISSGVENGNDPDAERIVRAVTGGTGRYAHVSGEVTQARIGRNTSMLRSFSHKGDVASPNFSFTFDLKVR